VVGAAYHNRLLCLYTKLGFDTREMLSKMFGPPLKLKFPGYEVRPATERDLEACGQLCRRIHGHDRGGELRDAIKQGSAKVVEHLGRITGYSTDIAFFGHTVGETKSGDQGADHGCQGDRRWWLSATDTQRRSVRWCLENGLRLVHQMTLMTIGLYNEPAGAYLPSVLY
jgi:hypothetical protein